uniref:Uncharacterized protein n=1 Tax=Arundo donax TaxID=35708 RepID=A0A0A9CYM3_ARUDO
MVPGVGNCVLHRLPPLIGRFGLLKPSPRVRVGTRGRRRRPSPAPITDSPQCSWHCTTPVSFPPFAGRREGGGACPCYSGRLHVVVMVVPLLNCLLLHHGCCREMATPAWSPSRYYSSPSVVPSVICGGRRVLSTICD